MPSHSKKGDSNRQWKRPAEPAPEIPELRIIIILQRGHHGLQRHPTFRAVTRLGTLNLWMHRACEYRPCLRIGRLHCSARFPVASRINAKLFHTLRTAEVMDGALMLDPTILSVRHLHTAYNVGVPLFNGVLRLMAVLVLYVEPLFPRVWVFSRCEC